MILSLIYGVAAAIIAGVFLLPRYWRAPAHRELVYADDFKAVPADNRLTPFVWGNVRPLPQDFSTITQERDARREAKARKDAAAKQQADAKSGKRTKREKKPAPTTRVMKVTTPVENAAPAASGQPRKPSPFTALFNGSKRKDEKPVRENRKVKATEPALAIEPPTPKEPKRFMFSFFGLGKKKANVADFGDLPPEVQDALRANGARPVERVSDVERVADVEPVPRNTERITEVPRVPDVPRVEPTPIRAAFTPEPPQAEPTMKVVSSTTTQGMQPQLPTDTIEHEPPQTAEPPQREAASAPKVTPRTSINPLLRRRDGMAAPMETPNVGVPVTGSGELPPPVAGPLHTVADVPEDTSAYHLSASDRARLDERIEQERDEVSFQVRQAMQMAQAVQTEISGAEYHATPKLEPIAWITEYMGEPREVSEEKRIKTLAIFARMKSDHARSLLRRAATEDPSERVRQAATSLIAS